MATTSGIVNEIKAKNTRFGDMYDVVVNGTAYGHGKYAPRGVKAGDFVTFDFETKVNGQYTNHNIVPKTLRVENQPAPAAVQAARAETKQVIHAADNRQTVISKQAALNTSIELTRLQLDKGGIKFPANAKAPDVYAGIEAAVLETATRLYKINTGDDWVIDTDEAKTEAASIDEFPEDTANYLG